MTYNIAFTNHSGDTRYYGPFNTVKEAMDWGDEHSGYTRFWHLIEVRPLETVDILPTLCKHCKGTGEL